MTALHDCHVIDWHIHGVHGTLIGERRHPANNDTNNCTVRALCDVFGLHLYTAYWHMAKHGRPHRRGPSWSRWKRACLDMAKQRGLYMMTLSRAQSRERYGATVMTAQRKLQPHQRVIINQRGHTMGWHNCQTTDWADGRRKHTRTIWEFLPKGEGIERSVAAGQQLQEAA